MTTARRKVVILGGGMAGLTAAWELSRPGWNEHLDTITVVQRGWRLGGKGASGRGPNGRIEEHGLHVWLGYYDNAFRLVRQVYEALDRPHRDPDAPLRTWRDAFIPAGRVGLAEKVDDEAWRPWMADFRTDNELPGGEDATAEAMSVDRFVRRGLALLTDFASSLRAARPTTATTASGREPLTDGRSRIELLSEVAAGELLRRFGNATAVAQLRRVASIDLVADPRWRRVAQLADLVATSILGIWRDRLLDDPRGFAAANDEDYRTWMRRHGAAESTLTSPLVNGVYDLVFGYRGGDPDEPAFAAGVGLILSAKMFFEYHGSLFWKTTTSMGDAVFAPLYQALVERGVAFRFFTDVKALHVSGDGRAIDGVTVAEQAEVLPSDGSYDPLIRVKGLPCWPSEPLHDQVRGRGPLGRETLESYGPQALEHRREILRRGKDFDDLIFALPAGVVSFVCDDLLRVSRRWRNLVRHLGTVATQSAQLWLEDNDVVVDSAVAGATVAGLGHPLDTYADMSQVLASEDWPKGDEPAGLAYFCSTLEDGDLPSSPERPGHDAKVRAAIVDRLEHRIGHLWPTALADDGRFRWDLLFAPRDVSGESRLDHQYWQANVDPSDRYVQSLPGTDRYRLAADESGFDHLVLAGDWTHNGLNAGCIEAAVRSGIQAANVVLGRPLDAGLAGFYGV